MVVVPVHATILDAKNGVLPWLTESTRPRGPIRSALAYETPDYSVEIIDRVTVDAYSLLREMSGTIRSLRFFKRKLMQMRSQTERTFSAARGYAMSESLRNHLKEAARETLGILLPVVETIERSFSERFGIERPD